MGREEVEESEEPEQEVPGMATASSSTSSVLPGISSDKMETVASPVSREEATETKDVKPKTIGAEVAALLEAVEAQTEPDVVLRKKPTGTVEKEEETDRRGSTFLTEIEDNEDVGPEVANIVNKIVSEDITDTVPNLSTDIQSRVEVVEPPFIEQIVVPLGTIEDVNICEPEPKVASTVESTVESTEVQADESKGDEETVVKTFVSELTKKEPVVKEIITCEELSEKQETQTTENVQEKQATECEEVITCEEISEKVQTQTTGHVQDPLVEESEETSPSEVEPIGAVEDLKVEVNNLLAPLTQNTDSQVDEDEEENSETALVDITVMKESEVDEPTTAVLEAASKSAEVELEEAINDIPEMSKSISAHDMLEASDQQEVEREGDIKKKNAGEGALIDITVIEETEKEKNINEVLHEAREAFVAEVIPDDADIQVETMDGEEVVTLTFENKDAIPLGAIAVATFAIFLALIFFYN